MTRDSYMQRLAPLMVNGAIDPEELERLTFYVDSANYVANESVGQDGDDCRIQLQTILDDVLGGNCNRARSLRALAKHYLCVIRFIAENTNALDQLRELKQAAMKLPLAETANTDY